MKAENGLTFLYGTIGKEGVEELKKFEAALYKPQSNLTVSIDEMVSGLKIVPRAVLSFLKEHLLSMEIGSSKDINIPFKQKTELHIEKIDTDVYNGSVLQNNKAAASFKFRSLPGVGLTLLTALELYDIANLESEQSKTNQTLENGADIQKEIDKKIKVGILIEKVKNGEISYRNAVQELVQSAMLSTLSHSLEKDMQFKIPQNVKKKKKNGKA